jgi:ABC-type branched-subunit amino acid transport system substrate-binding protein
VGLLAVASVACAGDGLTPASDDVATIAYLFDGAPSDAELVSAPALAGLELAAHRAGGIEIEPVNLGVARDEAMASLRALADDPDVVAAVVAPWTAAPSGAAELLADRGLPVVTLSWAWGPPPGGDGPWLSLAIGRAGEAISILSEATRTAPGAGSVCVAGDEHPTSLALSETVEELGRAAGNPPVVAVGIAPTGPAATAGAVARRIAEAGCDPMIWTGGAIAAEGLVPRLADPPAVFGTSRIKTDDGLAVATSGVEVTTVCACTDVSLSMEPLHQRFVHDLQAESGAPPGPFAVEAYDAGRLLTDIVRGIPTGSDTGDLRREVAAALHGLTGFGGLVGAYTLEPDGSRAPRTVAVGRWRAAGSRWLPAEGLTVPSG